LGRVRSKLAVVGAVAALLTAGLAASSSASAQRADSRERDPSDPAQIVAVLAEKASRSPAQAKISTGLLHEVRRERNDPLIDALPQGRVDLAVDPGGSVLVDIRASVDVGLLEQVAALGGVVVNSHPRFDAVRASLPLDAIEALAALPSVSQIRSADQFVTQRINTSEGDVAHRALTARNTFGATGAGVKTCAMSTSVDALATLQASGDLPAVDVLTGQSGNPGSSEGTAMLEIVHDLAPGTTLGYATALGGQAQFAQNILDLRSSGCDVIVDDVSYFAEPVFQDGIIADAVNTVVADGALFFSSAGNSGNLNDGTSGVWEGDFDPVAVPPLALAGQSVHDFGNGTGLNVITKDSPFLFSLQWADPQGGSANDYDLCLLNSAGTAIVFCSSNVQDGNDDPFEAIGSSGFNDTGLTLAIIKRPGASDRFLHLSAFRGTLAQATDGQTSGHSAANGAYSVAAVNQATTSGGAFTGGPANPVESFSSDGPRRVFFNASGAPYTPGDFLATGGQLRQKPDIAAADGVMTATPGFNPFFGTSAAAPHAAAIAALMLDADPTLTNARVDGLFSTTALDIEAPGVDRDSGYGIIDAFALVSALLVPSAPTGVSGVAGDGQVVVSWAAPASTGGSPITGYTVTATPGGGTCVTTGALSCTVSGLTNGTAYTFTVVATNAVATGAPSAPSSPVTPATVPGVASGVSGVAGDGQVVVSWAAPASTGGSPITGYTVTATPGGASCSTTGALSCTVSGLTNGTGYTFTVTATNAVGTGPGAQSPPITPQATFVPLTPSRIMNTRAGAKVGNAAGTGAPFVLKVTGAGGVPASGVAAVVLNVTVTNSEDPTIGGGFVTVYPCDKPRPDASNLNFVTDQTVPNSVIAPVSANGEVCFYVYGTTHLLADVSGYFRI
jgi:hypothetical protein